MDEAIRRENLGPIGHSGMNVFQLSIIASPVAGCIAAERAAAGHGAGVSAACLILGLISGAAAYAIFILGFGSLLSRVAVNSRQHNANGRLRSWHAGTIIVLLAIASPFVAWVVCAFASSSLVSALWR